MANKMPAFAVKINVPGPIVDQADGQRFDGAYSDRVVFAADERRAKMRAVEELFKEPQFAQIQCVDSSGLPATEVDEVRQVGWLAAFTSGGPLVFYRREPRKRR